jgi:hypothetical protein
MDGGRYGDTVALDVPVNSPVAMFNATPLTRSKCLRHVNYHQQQLLSTVVNEIIYALLAMTGGAIPKCEPYFAL